MLSKFLIKIFTTKMSVTSSGNDLENTVINGKKRHIEGTTSQIEDNNILFSLLLVHTVSNSGSSGLIDDTENIQTGDESSILGGLTLGIIEISRDCDNGMLDLTTKVSLGNLLHLG